LFCFQDTIHFCLTLWAGEAENLEIEKAQSAEIRSAWDQLCGQIPVAAYIAEDLQKSLGTLTNQEFLRVLENSQVPVAKVLEAHPLYSIDAMTKAFNDTFVNPIAQFRLAAEQLVNAPIARLRETTAQLAQVVESVTNPLGVLHNAVEGAGQSQAKAKLEKSGHGDGSEGDRSKVNASKNEPGLQEPPTPTRRNASSEQAHCGAPVQSSSRPSLCEYSGLRTQIGRAALGLKISSLRFPSYSATP
jgi:hypothetical protein